VGFRDVPVQVETWRSLFFLMLVVPRPLLLPTELLLIFNLSVLMLSIPEKGLRTLLPPPKGA